ncbi:response regulator [Cereibacter johrii]|uniref:response regulator n=1 Tax=Cereibacter johrii TaxID=445629 RepID=UPI002B25FB56|nr:response regulator [Cereibacter johrii]MEA5160874.1 response regulator [Cereibacter johrii]
MFFESRDTAPGGVFERWTGYVLIVAVGVTALVAAIFIFSDIDKQLEQNRVAHLDNRTWVLAQFEVDVLNLASAAQMAAYRSDDPARLDELRKRFDILYSRVDIVRGFDSGAIAPLEADVLPIFDGPQGFFARWIPVVDGPDAALRAALPQLIGELETDAGAVRSGVVRALAEVMTVSDARRATLRQSLQTFALAALGLLGLMGVLIAVVIVQSNARRRRGMLLERSVHNLRATIESSLDAVVVLDHMGRVVECNRAALDMFRWSPQTAEGTSFVDYIRTDDADGLLRPHARGEEEAELGSTGRDGRITMMAQRTDGSTFPVEVSVAEAQGASQDPFFIAFIRDISERLEREESLKKARNDALKGEEAKSRFLAVMSHEMRTPLNGLMAASDLLQTSTELTERQRWLTDIVIGCGSAALDQVNNVLELTRLSDKDGESYARTVFSPVDLIEGLIRQNQPQADKRGNKLWFAQPKTPVPPVLAQRHLFLRVMYNLIGNAIKFTDNGKVSVELLWHPGRTAGTIDLCIHVGDTGIGIAEEHLDTIFRNFETLDASYGRIREGTGLGLGIAKLAAETMGGQIDVQSKLGLGSVFTLRLQLPVAQGAEAAEEEFAEDAQSAEGAARSILVVDDNAINRQLLAEILRMGGHEVATAEDGAEAAEAAGARRFDLILMDVSMPRVDGLEATRRIRRAGASTETPIVGATAHADPDRVPEFLAAGMNDVLVKPITRSALFRTIRQYTEASAAVEEVLPAGDPPPDDLPLIDAELRADLEGNLGPDYIAGMIGRVLSETGDALPEMRRLHEAGEHLAAAKLAHRTAGAAAAVGLLALHRSLASYETAADASDTAEAARALETLPATLERTAAACQATAA